MNWKNWPYWVKGEVVGICGILFVATVISLLAFEAACEHFVSSCSITVRVNYLLAGLYLLLIVPILNFFSLFLVLFEYGPSEMMRKVGEEFFSLMIIPGIIMFSSSVGWLYGKIKNRNSTSPPASQTYQLTNL